MGGVHDGLFADEEEFIEALQTKSEAVHKLTIGTFETEIGAKFLKHLKDTYMDTTIYKRGSSLEDVAYRQGQSDLIKQILTEIKRSI